MEASPQSPDTVTSEVTGWFYRRTVLPGIICFAIAGWFFYDGTYTYPKRAKLYEEYRAYNAQYDLLTEETSSSSWKRAVDEWEKVIKNNPDLTEEMRWEEVAAYFGWAKEDPPPWKDYAEANDYYEAPKKSQKITPSKITEQLVYGTLFVLGALGFLGTAYFSRNRKLTADRESVTFPNGDRVPFTSIFQLDNRRWENQGFSLVKWKDANGAEHSSKLDCLKYETEGAEEVMKRILATPGIEVITTALKQPEAERAEGAAKAEEDESKEA